MTTHPLAAQYLRRHAPGHASGTAERYAFRAMELTALAVEAGVEGEELKEYICGLADMVGATVQMETADYIHAILTWDADMTKAGKELPFIEKFSTNRYPL